MKCETSVKYSFPHKSNTILLKFKEDMDVNKRLLFVDQVEGAQVLTNDLVMDILKTLGNLEKGYKTYTALTYMVLIENGVRKEKVFDSPPPPGYAIWD